MDTVSEGRLKEINPILAERVRNAANLLSQKGITIRVVQGLRSWAMQQELWQQGRDINGKVIDPKKVVTDAAPGTSWHEFGLGIDVAPFDENGQPIWDYIHSPGKEMWEAIINIAPQVQLFSGACFHSICDRPHYQPMECEPSPNDEVRLDFREAGMTAIWEALGLTGSD